MAIADALVASGLACVRSVHDSPTGVTGSSERLEDCALAIVVISRAGVASQSLAAEAREAARFFGLVVCFYIDDVALPALWPRPLERIDATSMGGAFDEHVRRLVAVVADLLGSRGGVDPWVRSGLESLSGYRALAKGPLSAPDDQDVLPPPITDNVHFSVTSSSVWIVGQPALLDVWAHLDNQRSEVLERARENIDRRVSIKTQGPVRIARGSQLTVRLRIDGVAIDEPEDTVLWEHEIGHVTFCVPIPADTPEGLRAAVATIHLGGLRILSLRFAVELRRATAPARPEPLPIHETRHRTAFASYASADETAVLARVQGISKGQPDIDIFYAPHSLRSGETWKLRLEEEIERRDVFYLFWSKAARESAHVEWEWRHAIKVRGIDYIDPVPLVSPAEVPPPAELAALHFNDWMLARMRGP
jgi:hypothetical protein